ncbi:MAG: hypothetical protein GXP32_09300, partial [Kiritimatiellaeota bacterium]|nr:hypothetical protein [Kiritimatiellota bacterium]
REALEYAERNKALNNLRNVSFLLGNILSPVEESSESVGERFGKFDLIVANLPYVSRPLYEKLPRGIRGYEPEDALLAGEDGLDVIRGAAKAVSERLVSGGTVIFEHSPEQSAAMSAIIAENGFAEIATIKDLTGRDRFTTGGKQGGPSRPSFHPRSSR